MGTLWQDVRFGVRMLVKDPTFTVVVLLVVGVGIGAATAIFNALDQISLRALPVRRPKELVSIQYRWRSPNGDTGYDGICNYRVYEAYRDQSEVFSGLIAFFPEEMRLCVNDDVLKVKGMGVTGNYFSVLGVNPALGRLFVAERERDPVDHPVAVISDRLWRRHFERKADVIGKQIVINDRSLTIIGVTPRRFNGTAVGWAADVYVSVGTLAHMWDMDAYTTDGTWLYFLGRLKPGINREQAQASLRVLSGQLKDAGYNVHTNVVAFDGRRGWTAWKADDFHRPVTLLLIAAVFILIIATVNTANMQLSRAASRQKEIAVRQALGAGRWRVIRQLLVESLLLALAAGVCGLVLAVWLDRIVCALLSRIGSVSMIPGLNLRVLLCSLGVSLLAGIVFGLTPALQVVRRNVTPALKQSCGFVGEPSRFWNPHHPLVVFQVAMAVMIMICASLFVRSVIALNSIHPGYDTRRLLAVSLEGWNFERPDLRQFFENLRERVKGLPGVETTSLANLVPLGEAGAMRGVSHINGVEIPKNERSSWWYGVVGPEYFEVLNMPLLAGRIFSGQDDLTAPKVMVINDIMARKHWPNQNPMGQSVTFRGREGDLVVTVIGVVRACKMRSIIEGDRPIAYWPLAQDTRITPTLLIRATGNPRALIPIIRKNVASQRLSETCHISTVAGRVADLLFPQHAVATILSVFGFAGLVLCVTGLYSVMAYAVRQRTQEIGIRMAVGAGGHHVVMSVLRRGAWLTAVGLGLGLGLSLVAVRILENQLSGLQGWNQFILYGVSLWDPLTFAAMPALVLTIALIACYVPARRAAKIDPIAALRYE